MLEVFVFPLPQSVEKIIFSVARKLNFLGEDQLKSLCLSVGDQQSGTNVLRQFIASSASATEYPVIILSSTASSLATGISLEFHGMPRYPSVPRIRKRNSGANKIFHVQFGDDPFETLLSLPDSFTRASTIILDLQSWKPTPRSGFDHRRYMAATIGLLKTTTLRLGGSITMTAVMLTTEIDYLPFDDVWTVWRNNSICECQSISQKGTPSVPDASATSPYLFSMSTVDLNVCFHEFEPGGENSRKQIRPATMSSSNPQIR